MDDKIEYFESKFENLTIHVQNMIFESFNETESKEDSTAFTNVWEDLKVYNMVTYITMVGKVYVMFRDQLDRDNKAIFITAQISLKADDELDAANVFTKLLQYLFEWTTKYVLDHGIVGNNNKPFMMPGFQYSRDRFANHF